MSKLLTPSFAVVFLSVTLAGCGGHGGQQPGAVNPETPAFVEVQNQDFYDMTVRIVRSDVPVRLGMVPGGSTAVLRIPGTYVNSGLPVRFVADPIGGGRAPYSQEINVWPGDTVVIRILPN